MTVCQWPNKSGHGPGTYCNWSSRRIFGIHCPSPPLDALSRDHMLPNPSAPTGAGACRYSGTGLGKHWSPDRRQPAPGDLPPDRPRRRRAPLGQLREALARQSARLKANSSNICCSRSENSSRRHESDSEQSDIKCPHRNAHIEPQNHEAFCTFLNTAPSDFRQLAPKVRAFLVSPDWYAHCRSSSFLPNETRATQSARIRQPRRRTRAIVVPPLVLSRRWRAQLRHRAIYE